MSLLDTFTGGKSGEAGDALKRAEGYYGNIQTPTIGQLTLPELQKYVEAGIITPAQAQSYLQQNNAYADQNIDQSGTAGQIEALNKLSAVTDAGEMGTPAEQAAMENSISQMNTAVGGQRGAIEQEMAARGTPMALIQAALSNQSLGQDAQQAHLDAVNAQGQAYQAALNAMSQAGSLGGQLQGQQNTQANTVAGAANAMQQFNAQNQQQNSQFNAGNTQEANMANAANRQQIANNNTGLSNSRTMYNANLPQQNFNNQMQKAAGQAGAATAYGNMQQAQGGQNAGIISGLINTATSFIPKPGGAAAGGGGGMSQAPSGYSPNVAPNQYAQLGYAQGGIIGCGHSMCHGGVCMADGGEVPGESNFPGDSPMNDTVHAQLSPGEAVIPRSSVEQNPDTVMSLLGDQGGGQNSDVQDVATILKALRAIRMGA